MFGGSVLSGVRVAALAAIALALAACANPWLGPDGEGPPQAYRPNRPSHAVVGNYCGFGSRDGDLSARPVDRLDAACLEHDTCYIEGRDRCDCNNALLLAAQAIAADPLADARLRLRAHLVHGFFVAAVPVCTVWPHGILRPRRQDVLATRYHAPDNTAVRNRP